MLGEMLQISAEATTTQILDALFVLVVLASDISNFVSTPSGGIDLISSYWQRLDELYSWCQRALSLCSITFGQGSGVCQVSLILSPFITSRKILTIRHSIQVYAGAIWASAVMLEFTLVEHLTAVVTQLVTKSSNTFGTLDTDQLTRFVELRNFAQSRTLGSVCSFLQINRVSVKPFSLLNGSIDILLFLQQLSKVSTLGIIHRIGCSISRVIDLAEAFSSASSNDLSLFPQASIDKCASLE